MKLDGSDFQEKDMGKSEVEKLFDNLLFQRQIASITIERLRIIKELECLLQEDQIKFSEYLSDTISLYEAECKFSLDDMEGVHYDSEIDPPAYLDGEGNIVDINDFYYDKNTTVLQYLDNIRKYIIFPLQAIKTLWDNKRIEETTAELKAAHNNDFSMFINAKKRIEKDFPLLETITMKAIEDSPDVQKNETLKKSLDEMRDNFRKNGLDV